MENIITQPLENLNTLWEKADADFASDLTNLSQYEQKVREAALLSAAEHIALTLESIDRAICDSLRRKEKYNIQRVDSRTIITTLGEVTFSRTYFKNRETEKYSYLLDDLLHLDSHERMSELAEAKILEEAIDKSYSKGGKALDNDCIFSKVAVMNKVHNVISFPDEAPKQKKKVKVLYVEADEDHIAAQKGAKDRHPKGMIGKLVYIYEDKEDVCKGRRKLVYKHHIGGLYYGDDNKNIWKDTWRYIDSHYDTEYLETIYVGSDSGGWIKAAETELDKAVMAIDKYHLMKYINAAAHQMLDEDVIAKEKIWKYLTKGKKKEFQEIMKEMISCANNIGPIVECRDYILNNWKAVKTRMKLDRRYGCSAEGHVSHIYSDRLSSRPMGWCETGADRMCLLRCFVENYGKEKIIDLVKYTRQRKHELKATGTDGAIVNVKELEKTIEVRHLSYGGYIERMQVSLPGYNTVRKKLAIQEQIGFI